jgi:CBS domain-containing protein
VAGLQSSLLTKLLYIAEDAFGRLKLHWMWWPALGGLCVGLIGFVAPHTLGVGYDNIERIVSGSMVSQAIVILCALKLVSWAIALGSGTSGGTLAPLLTLGSGLGAALGAVMLLAVPRVGVDVRIAALVGMAAMFAGASRALLASVVFAFEVTRQPIGLLPLLAGCTSAFLTSCLIMEQSIMTEKIVRRGVRVLGEYSADFLDQVSVRACCTGKVVAKNGRDTIDEMRAWLDSGVPDSTHQGFPIIDDEDRLLGVLTRRDLLASLPGTTPLCELVSREPVVIYDDCSLRDAADRMAWERIGRLPVVSRAEPKRVIGIVTRSDLLHAHVRRLEDHHVRSRGGEPHARGAAAG